MAQFFTTAQAAIYLGVSDSYFRRVVRKGLVSFEGEGRNRVFSLEALEDFRRGTPKEIIVVQGYDEPEEIALDFSGVEIVDQACAMRAQIDWTSERVPVGLQAEIEEAAAPFLQALKKLRNYQRTGRAGVE